MALSLFTFGLSNAQTVEGKQKSYLPEKGDFAIGIDLKPILNYAGNIFNGNMNNTIDNIGGEPVSNNLDGFNKMNGIAPDVSIMGKYMLNEKWGIRTNIGMLLRSNSMNYYVQNDEAVMLDPFDASKLVDRQKSRKNGMSVMLGAEYRKGTRRIQGVFGFGALIGFQNVTNIYSYANKLTEINNSPSTSLTTVPSAPIAGYRVTKQKSDADVFYGVTGSAGIEWFVAPKISLGAEVNLSLYGISGGQEYLESEGYNTSSEKIEKRYDLVSPGNNAFRFGLDNVGGSLYMSFYF